MKESKAYKTYLGVATGSVPPKAARKFKKASLSKKDNVPVPEDEEPVKKGKRLKTTAKNSAYKPAKSIVIREPAVETKSKSKEKEKVDVAHGKGIELLSDVALTEEDQMKEVRKKSLKDFHKIHPSGSGMVVEDPPSVAKITPPVTRNDEDDSNEEHVSSDKGSKEENESDKQASDSEQEEESEDDDQEENKDDDDLELENARLEEPTKTATRIVQGEGTNAEMTESQQGNENLETTQEQVVEDAHVTISTVIKKTEVPVTSSSPLEKEVAELKKDPLHTQVTSLVNEHLDTRLGETREEFMNLLSESFTARIKEQVKDQFPQILPQEVSNFAPPVIEKLFHETRDEVTLAKASSQP
ncbi:hypothetical protein Tco_0566325 [Tanacetum coccineum]